MYRASQLSSRGRGVDRFNVGTRGPPPRPPKNGALPLKRLAVSTPPGPRYGIANLVFQRSCSATSGRDPTESTTTADVKSPPFMSTTVQSSFDLRQL